MDNIDLKISEEINTEQKPKEKGIYQKLEDSYYNTLDKINKVFPIYKIIDPIDKVVPSFIIVNIFFLLFIAAIIIVLVLLLNSSAMKVNFDFYYDNARVNENLLVNISYTGFDKNFNTDKNSLVLKLNKDLEIKLKVLSENYEFERSYPIVENYIKVNIPKKEIIDTTPKKISIFAYEYPNKSTIYNSNIMLSLRCLSSGRTENISLAGLKDYNKAYDCGNIRFTGNVSGFKSIDFTCSNTETSCAIPLVTFTDRTPEEENLTPKNGLVVQVFDDSNKHLKDVEVFLNKKTSLTSEDKNTDAFGEVTYLNLEVGYYELKLDYNGIQKFDSNVYIFEQSSNIYKKYVFDLTEDVNSKFDLSLDVDTFDGNVSKFDLYIYDVNGDVVYSQKNKSTQKFFETVLLYGTYYLSAVPNEDYNPMYFYEFNLNDDLDLNVIFDEYNADDFFKLNVTVLDSNVNKTPQPDIKVSIRNVDNNNLVYDSKSTDKTGRAIFTLPNNLDYVVFAEKTGFFAYDEFESEDIEDNKGVLVLVLEKQNKKLSFEFTLDNDKIPYTVYLDLATSNDLNFSGEGKININIPAEEKVEISVIAEKDFDVYNYLLSPRLFSHALEYNLKYNYNTDSNIKVTDVKLDSMLSKDVNDMNLLANKDYYFGVETELECNNGIGTFNMPYSILGGNLDVLNNDYLTLNNNLFNLKLNPSEKLPCFENGVVNYYKFNSFLKLTTVDHPFEGYFKYNKNLDKNVLFSVPGRYICNISLNSKDLSYYTAPYIVPNNSKIVFSNSCSAVYNNNVITEFNFNIPGKYTFYYGNYVLKVYVLAPIKAIYESEPFEKIRVNYSDNVDCSDYYCSVEQLFNNPVGLGKVKLSDDNFAVLSFVDLKDNAVDFKGVGDYFVFLNKISSYKAYNSNHIFYKIPYSTNVFLTSGINTLDYNKTSDNYGTCSSVLFSWNNEDSISFCNADSKNYAKLNISLQYDYLKVLEGNNYDINIYSGISIKRCLGNYNDCYNEKARYYLQKNNITFDSNNILDINNIKKSISFKSEYLDFNNAVYVIAVVPAKISGWTNYSIDSLQSIIDYYNNKFILFDYNDISGKYIYYWNFK